jgi:hypothetical protein
MNAVHTIEIFSAGCPFCTDVIDLVSNLASESVTVSVSNVNDPAMKAKAKQLGVTRVPSVTVDGELLDCCSGKPVDIALIKTLIS